MIIKYEITRNPKYETYTTRMYIMLSEAQREREISEALHDRDYYLARELSYSHPNQWDLQSSATGFYADIPAAYWCKWRAAGCPSTFIVIVESYTQLHRDPYQRPYTHRHNRHDRRRLDQREHTEHVNGYKIRYSRIRNTYHVTHPAMEPAYADFTRLSDARTFCKEG